MLLLDTCSLMAEGIKKLLHRYQKYIDRHCKYLEKLCKGTEWKYIFLRSVLPNIGKVAFVVS